MHANELLRRIIGRLPHHTEGERDEMLAAVDTAFPVAPPQDDADADADEPSTPDGKSDTPTVPLFSDTTKGK